MTMLVVWAAVLLAYGVSAGNAMHPAGIGAGAGAGAGTVVGAVVGALVGARTGARVEVGAVIGAVVGAGAGAAVGAVVGAVVGAAVGDVVRDVAGTDSYLPLDMAPNSVDDMYSRCNKEMSEKAPQYLQNEKNKNNKFKEVWDRMMVNNRRWRRALRTLSTEQLVAIQVYTDDRENLYKDFNDAVRSQRPQYKDLFRFHALHFYLTSAIQALSDKCLTVYRRVDEYFNQDVVNKEIRFGSFTSTSLDQYIDADVFGDKSCFKIDTCMGAEISMYSTFPDEREVLIPPYEVFKVVGIKKRSQHPDLPCEVEYKLESTKMPVSNLNCALIPK